MNILKEMNPEFAKDVEANDGYCPCAIDKTEDTKCPCKPFREETKAGDLCICGRYQKVEE